MGGWRTSFLRIAQLWCTSRDATVSHLEPMEAIRAVWAGAHLAALHFSIALGRAGVVGSQGARGAVLGLLLRQLRSNRPPVLLGRGQALAAEGVLQQLHRCRPVLRRRPQTPAMRQRAEIRAFRSWAKVLLQLEQSWVTGGIRCSCGAVSLAVLADPDINICPDGSFGAKLVSSPREGTHSRVKTAELRVELFACQAKADIQA